MYAEVVFQTECHTYKVNTMYTKEQLSIAHYTYGTQRLPANHHEAYYL